jgi:ATP-binding cassette subfamily C protein LapB
VWQALETNLRPSDILIVSTHRPLMASRLVNRVLIMQQGRVVRDGKPEALLPQMARQASLRPAAQGGKADAV